MKTFHALWLLALPSSFAQYNYGGSGSSSTSASSGQPSATSSASNGVQTVTVGQSGLKFNPDSLVVAPGKTVVFQFYPGNHGFAQSSFEAPCAPANDSSVFSGFINSNSGAASNVFTLTVNSTDPIWFYCPQISHCQAGMVGVINPPSTGQTLDQYRSAAANTGSSSAPPNAQGGMVGPQSSATQSGTSSASSAASTSDGEVRAALSWAGMILPLIASFKAFGL